MTRSNQQSKDKLATDIKPVNGLIKKKNSVQNKTSSLCSKLKGCFILLLPATALLIAIAALTITTTANVNKMKVINAVAAISTLNKHSEISIDIKQSNGASGMPSQTNENQISKLIEAMLQKQEKQRSTPSSSGSRHKSFAHSPVSVHKFLLAPEETANGGPRSSYYDHEVAKFNSTNVFYPYEHVRGLDVRHNGIILKFTGLYYIYSSIHSKPSNACQSMELSQKTNFHYVHRISPNNPMYTGVLLRSVYTCSDNDGLSGDTLFTGGIFYLNEGDVIQVCFSDSQTVDFDYSSYFGLFMLGSS